MKRDCGANVVGIDIEAHLIERAQNSANKLGLNTQTDFQRPGSAADDPRRVLALNCST